MKIAPQTTWEGMAALLPDYENFKIKVILTGDGARYMTEFPILERYPEEKLTADQWWKWKQDEAVSQWDRRDCGLYLQQGWPAGGFHKRYRKWSRVDEER